MRWNERMSLYYSIDEIDVQRKMEERTNGKRCGQSHRTKWDGGGNEEMESKGVERMMRRIMRKEGIGSEVGEGQQ